MNKKFMSALICAFSRAYHSKVNKVKIFDDTLAESLFTNEEKNEIKENMSSGIKFFNPDFSGNKDEALRWVVDNYLSPSPLGRAAFAEEMLKKSVENKKVKQYLIFAAGYDTFAYTHKEYSKCIEIFEIDHPDTADDKIKRLKRASIQIPENTHYVSADFTKENWINALTDNEKYDKSKISFCSILGLSYYLSKNDFDELIEIISKSVPNGSLIVFDYPSNESETQSKSEKSKKQMILAEGAGEKMIEGYSYNEIEEMFKKHNFQVLKHLIPNQITAEYFEEYNKANPDHYISAFDNVNYCLCTKIG